MFILIPLPFDGRREWHPTPVLLPGKSHGRRRLVSCSPWGLEESDTTEPLHFSFYCILSVRTVSIKRRYFDSSTTLNTFQILLSKDKQHFKKPKNCGKLPWQNCWILDFCGYFTVTKEKAMAPNSSTLAWKIPWMEEPGRLKPMGSWRVGHDWATSLSLFTFMHWRRKRQPTPVFLPGESQGRRSLVGCRLWGRTELDTTEAT